MPHRPIPGLARRLAAGAGGALLLAGLLAPAVPAGAAVAPTEVACPPAVGDLATCWSGQDDHGAWYTFAVPDDWNGDLVVHAHGGPDLGEESDPRAAWRTSTAGR
jgi:hypothetical protein